MFTTVVLASLLSAAPSCKAPVKDVKAAVGPCDQKPVEACLAAGDALITQCRDEALARRTLAGVVWERRQAAVRLVAATGGGWTAK